MESIERPHTSQYPNLKAWTIGKSKSRFILAKDGKQDSGLGQYTFHIMINNKPIGCLENKMDNLGTMLTYFLISLV